MKRTLVVAIITNIIVSTIKICSGIICNAGSLVADGFYTITELISNIISYFGINLSNKRKNKTHPFGYGMIEYITNLFVGILTFLLGCFIIIKSFLSKEETINSSVIFIILGIILIKGMLGIFLFNKSKKYKNNTLLISFKQSFLDLFSSIGVLIIIILTQFADKYPFLKYSDFIGTLIIGIIALKESISIISKNIKLLSIQSSEYNKEELIKALEKIKNVDVKDITLISLGSYYKAEILIDLNDNMKIKDVLRLEKKIKKELNKTKYKIKYVSIEVM